MPAYGVISANEIGLFMEKQVVHGECPLFPKADVQNAGKSAKLGFANGHKQPFPLT